MVMPALTIVWNSKKTIFSSVTLLYVLAFGVVMIGQRQISPVTFGDDGRAVGAGVLHLKAFQLHHQGLVFSIPETAIALVIAAVFVEITSLTLA